MLFGHHTLVLVLGLVTLYLSYLPFSAQLDIGLFKQYSQVLPNEELPSQTVLVTADDLLVTPSGSVSYLRLAELIDRLDQNKVAGIGLLLPLFPQQSEHEFDQVDSLLASEPENNRKRLGGALANLRSDQRLVTAIQNSGRVVLGAGFNSVEDGVCWLPESQKPLATELIDRPWYSPLMEVPGKPVAIRHFTDTAFMSAAAAMGSFCQPNEHDVFQLVLASEAGYYPSFLMQLQIIKEKAKLNSRVVEGRGVAVGYAIYQTGPSYRLLPHPSDYALERITKFTATDILASDARIKALRNKIVLVGIAGGEQPLSAARYLSADYPVKNTQKMMLTLSHAIDALTAQRYYSTPEWLYLGQRLAILSIVLYLLILPRRLRGIVGMVINILIVVAMMNVTLVVLLTKNIWMPLSLPIGLLLVASLVLLARHRISSLVGILRHEAVNAYRELARNYQSQGQLDIAFEYLIKCPVDRTIAEPLYNLGIDYERRRQFSKAVSVYSLLMRCVPGYRDTEARTHKLTAMPAYFPTTDTSRGSASMATMIMDDVEIARPVIGRFQIERELGRGAMGMVYIGKDPKISRVIAIKTLALADEFEQSHLDSVKQRFYQEAETAGQLNHPNIVTIYDVGEEHDLAYIAMDYIPGSSLDVYTKVDALLPIEEVIDIGIDIANALDYAHRRKVVHRDVKPANIIYDRDNKILKVTDFGIACLTDHSKTRTGTVLGSPFYMSPEQIAGKRVDGRSDLYSLGVTLYQLFTGQLPFAGDSLATLMYRISNEKPESIHKVRKELPSCLTRIICRVLDKDAAKRFQSGKQFADALYGCAERSHLKTSNRVMR